MTIIANNHRQVWPGLGGFAMRMGASPSVATQATISAAGHYSAMVMQAETDMTITHVGGRNGAATGSPSMTIRIETAPTNATSGVPTGTLWATNTVTGAVSPTNNGWTAPAALTASATITRGQVFCVKWLWTAGSIAVQRLAGPNGNGSNYPYGYDSAGTPAKTPNAQRPWFLGSSATTPYLVNGCWPVSTVANSTFNGVANARALRFTAPFSGRAIGLVLGSLAATTGDVRAVMWNDAGTVLATSPTIAGLALANSATGPTEVFFSDYFDFTAGTVYRIGIEPQTATNTQISTFALASATFRSGWPHGTNAHYATRAASVWTDTATDTLCDVDLIYIPDSGGSGGGGISVFGSSGGVIQ